MTFERCKPSTASMWSPRLEASLLDAAEVEPEKDIRYPWTTIA